MVESIKHGIRSRIRKVKKEQTRLDGDKDKAKRIK
jgi:hypothetical protein